MTRYYLGDFAGAEEHFTAELQFFDDPGFRNPTFGATVLAAYAFASWNAQQLGHFDVARERIARMMTLVKASNPYEVAFSWMFDALHRLGLREYEQAEASAARRSIWRKSIKFLSPRHIPGLRSVRREHS
jgi:hypothetical protein